MEQVEQRKQELLAAIAAVVPDTKLLTVLEIVGGKKQYAFMWMVCERCKRVHLHNEFLVHRQCSCFGENCRSDEKLLLAAYTAARQARFDGKDHFPWQDSSDGTVQNFSL